MHNPAKRDFPFVPVLSPERNRVNPVPGELLQLGGLSFVLLLDGTNFNIFND